jgi:hypothetical protein
MEENNNAVVVAERYNVVSTPEQIRANVNLIQNVMAKVMHKGTHFDTVPGCGPKPTLLKPGAEKLCSTFLLAPDPIIEDLSTADERRYRIKCRLIHSPSGTFMGSGIGECSSNEEKYKWRKAISIKEYEATTEDRRRIKFTYNDEIKQIRVNIADIANTVLKMAKKRALVDGVLTVTGASDMFTQDIEDMEFEPKANAPISQPPQRRSAQEPTADELKELAAKKAAEYHQGEEQPKTAPKAAQTPSNGVKTAKGAVISKSVPNKGGYVKYNLEGHQNESGYDIGFSTNDTTIMETLDTKLETGAVATIEYTEVVNGKYTNYNITGLVAVE